MMIEMLKRSIRCWLLAAVALVPLAGIARAQEEQEEEADIQNVLLTFHLVEADGFTGDDPEISDVVTELRKLFNFQGYKLLATAVFNVGLARTSDTPTGYLDGAGSQRMAPVDFDEPLMIRAELSSRRLARTVRAKVTLTEVITRTIGIPRNATEPLPLLEATATFSDGQRMVLGTPRRSAGEPVLILIVTSRIDPVL